MCKCKDHCDVPLLVPALLVCLWLCVQVMVAKVSSLLKTVKNVEDEAGRGVRSLENTIDSIDADLEVYDSDALPKIEATPQDLIRSTKVSRVHSVSV